MKFVGVTSCPTGIAHTYMAAEALEQAAKAAGPRDARRDPGLGRLHAADPAVIDAADAVIFAHDLEVKDAGRFAGKPIDRRRRQEGHHRRPGAHRAGRGAGRREPRGRRRDRRHRRRPRQPPQARAGPCRRSHPRRRHVGTKIRQWLMTGVSYMIPFVAAGGILIALGFMLAQVVGGETGAIDVTKQYSLTAPTSNGITNIFSDFNPGAGCTWAALLFVIGALGVRVPRPDPVRLHRLRASPTAPAWSPASSAASSPARSAPASSAASSPASSPGSSPAGSPAGRCTRACAAIMPVVVIPLLSTLVTGGCSCSRARPADQVR